MKSRTVVRECRTTALISVRVLTIVGQASRREFWMWVVSLKRLREFWAIHPRANVGLRAWFDQTQAAQWRNFGELRATFSSADLVGNCTVFDIGGNHYRLITRVLYSSHKVYVLRVMTHNEYDRKDWASRCGCFQPPPKRVKPGARAPRLEQRPPKRRSAH
jgi:mRNA interferase HigB